MLLTPAAAPLWHRSRTPLAAHQALSQTLNPDRNGRNLTPSNSLSVIIRDVRVSIDEILVSKFRNSERKIASQSKAVWFQSETESLKKLTPFTQEERQSGD